jgi:hypothetical protein
MKRLLFVLSFAPVFFACSNDKAPEAKTDEKKVEAVTSDVNYAYKASYSSDFKMGDPNHSKLVLDFFKGWEDGSMKGWKDMVADSVWIHFPDGQDLLLSRDSMIATAGHYRAMSSTVKIDVEAFLPVHVNDKNEDYVLVWEKDYSTDKKTGKMDSSGIQSFWQIKNNKIAGWQEYNRKLVAAPMKK